MSDEETIEQRHTRILREFGVDVLGDDPPTLLDRLQEIHLDMLSAHAEIAQITAERVLEQTERALALLERASELIRRLEALLEQPD